MNRLYTFFLFLALIGTLSVGLDAQTISFQHEDAVEYLLSAEDQDTETPTEQIKISNFIYNNTDTRYQLDWEMLDADLPDGWTVSVCFGTTCYEPGVTSSAQLNIQAPIEENDSLDFSLLFSTNGAAPGFSQAIVKIDNGVDIIESSFRAEVSLTGVEEIIELEKEFLVYPNPARNFLNIDFVNYEEVHFVEIYNMLGKVVERSMVENTAETKKIDVSSLSEGMFFISLLDNNNQLIETKRFSKVH